MYYSEEFHGRLQALAAILAWVAAGWLAMILILDSAHLIGHGLSGFRDGIRPAVMAGVLIWLLPSALSWTRDFSDLARDDHSSIPKRLVVAVVLLGVALGATSVFVHQTYVAAHVQGLAAYILSMAVIAALAIAYAAAAARFAIFPGKPGWDV